MPLAKVPGGDIPYEASGAGAPLVLLLPQSAGPVGVGPFVAGLEGDFTVIRYDQRGTGQSPPPADAAAISMADRAGEAAGLLDALGLPSARLFGHSTGCGVGLALAHAHGERVEGMVLAAPWSHGDAYLSTMQHLRVAAAAALGPADYARFNASLLFPPEYRRAHAAGFGRQAADAAPQDAAQISARLEAILAFDSRPILPRIPCPTLAMTAADDQLMPAWFGREIAAGLPDARFVDLSGGGHMLPETRTADMLRLTLDFRRAGGALELQNKEPQT